MLLLMRIEDCITERVKIFSWLHMKEGFNEQGQTSLSVGTPVQCWWLGREIGNSWAGQIYREMQIFETHNQIEWIAIIKVGGGQKYCQVILQSQHIQVQTSFTGCVESTLFRSASTFQLNKRNLPYYLYLSILQHQFKLLAFFPKQICLVQSYINVSIWVFFLRIIQYYRVFDPMNNQNEVENCTESPPFPNLCIPVSQHKLQKMTRILMDEQIKTMNRIQIFKKTTAKMIHDKEKEIIGLRKRVNKPDRKSDLQFQIHRIQPVVHKPSVTRNLQSQCSMRSLKSLKSITSSRPKEVIQLAQHRRLSKKVNEQLIAKERQKNLRKNLKSAKLIRSGRENIKSAKQNYFEWKIGAVRQQNQQNLQKEYTTYLEKFKKIEQLKKMQLMALSQWKRNKEAIDKIYQQVRQDKEQ